MSTARTPGPLLLAIALLLASAVGLVLLLVGESEVPVRSGAADFAGSDTRVSGTEPIPLADASSRQVQDASGTSDVADLASASPSSPTERSSVDDGRTWRDVIQPRGARTDAAFEAFAVVVLRPDGSRSEYAADDTFPGTTPLADALAAIEAAGHCPRFTTGPELERATDDERRAKLVPRATLTITTDLTSPWYHEIDALQVVRADLRTMIWASDELLHGPMAQSDFMAFAAALRATLDPALTNAARAMHFAFARQHAAYSRVTSLARVEPPVAFYSPFAAYRVAGPVDLPLTLDPVATNGALQIGVRSAGAFRFDTDPERAAGFPSSAKHLERPFRLEPDQHLTSQILFAPQSGLVARFPVGATEKFWCITFHVNSDKNTSSLANVSHADDGEDVVAADGLLPGAYTFSASWKDLEGAESHASVAFELVAGELRDLGTLEPDHASVATITLRFYYVDDEGFQQPVDAASLAGATGRVEVVASGAARNEFWAERVLVTERERPLPHGPLVLRGLAAGPWEARLVDLDLGDVPWMLAPDQAVLAFVMPGEIQTELPVRLRAKSPLAVRLYVSDDVLTPGIHFVAEMRSGGSEEDHLLGFAWEPGGGAVAPHAVATTSVPSLSCTVVARAFFPKDHPSEPSSVWIATAQFMPTPPSPVGLDLVLAPGATATIAAEALASGSLAAELGFDPNDRLIEPVVRDRAVGRAVSQTLLPDGDGAIYRGLLPSTDYRFVGTDVGFRTSGPGSTVVALE